MLEILSQNLNFDNEMQNYVIKEVKKIPYSDLEIIFEEY